MDTKQPTLHGQIFGSPKRPGEEPIRPSMGGSVGRGGPVEAGHSWMQVVQGSGCFHCETTRKMEVDTAALDERFSCVIAFFFDEVTQVFSKPKLALLDKFLRRNFSLDFIQNELRLRWNLTEEFQVLSLSKGILLFWLPLEKEKNYGSAKGPWSLAGQLLALEG